MQRWGRCANPADRPRRSEAGLAEGHPPSGTRHLYALLPDCFAREPLGLIEPRPTDRTRAEAREGPRMFLKDAAQVREEGRRGNVEDGDLLPLRGMDGKGEKENDGDRAHRIESHSTPVRTNNVGRQHQRPLP